jgi:hypothetical protein
VVWPPGTPVMFAAVSALTLVMTAGVCRGVGRRPR